MIVSQIWKANQVARKVSAFTGLPYEDLRSAALEYIVKIYDTYDGSKGANFSTWVNRCLTFHMLNYLRDHSRLVKIPRNYTEIHLRMRKLIAKNPAISDDEMAEKLSLTKEIIQEVKKAFAMGFSQINEEVMGIENEIDFNDEIEGFISEKKELLFRITELDPMDEQFLVDSLIKRRSLSTLVRKNPDIRTQEDVDKKIQSLKDFVIYGEEIKPIEHKRRRKKKKVCLSA
jgi:DNA-directed RNA polymerase sigma subunit (sigma70/sigma32)